MVNEEFKKVFIDMYEDITNFKTKESTINRYSESICDNFPYIVIKSIYKCLCSNKYLQATKDLEFSDYGLDKVNLSNERIIELSKEIIESINPNFVSIFNNFVKNKSIKIRKSFIYDNITKFHPASYNRKFKKLTKTTSEKIILYKNPDYCSVCTLIHEFMHVLNHRKEKVYTNLDNNKNIRTEFTEFISIYFEFYAREYLMKKYGINNNQIDFSERFITSKSCAIYDLKSYLPILCYKLYGNFNYTVFIKAIEDLNLELDPDSIEYKSVVKTAYKDIKKTKDMVIGYNYYKNRDEEVASNYDNIFLKLWYKACEDNYVLNSLLFFGIKDSFTKEDVLDLNNIITENDGDRNKFKKDKFKLFADYYIKMLEDTELDIKIKDYISSMFTKEGKLKKNCIY